MYDEYYGFSGKPFQLTPDQRFFFNSPGHSRALAYLRYGIEQREGFVVITGGVGTGKTILILTLLDELDGQDILAGQLVTTQVDPEDMLRMVCATFGLSHDGLNKSGMLDLLYAFAIDQRRDGRRILLVVDEAQHLPTASLEELRMLANYQVDGQSLFQSFLLGQEELRSTLRGPGMEQLRQRIIAAHHLDPLSVEETRSYIDYRLACVDWHGVPVFQDGVVERIHDLCSGVPRMINGLCDRLLLFGCIEERQTLDIRDVDRVGDERRREVGTTTAYGTGTEQGPMGQFGSGTDTPSPVGFIAEPGGDQLLDRVSRLEEEVARLRQLVKRERHLLRKAILIQLDLGAYDDFE